MTQKLINLGAAANDRTGSTWREGGTIINGNASDAETRLSALETPSDKTVYVAQESDFPIQDATTITLEANTSYMLMASFSVSKNMTVENGVAFKAPAFTTHSITFTGSGTFMTGVDASIYLADVQIILGATNQGFDFLGQMAQLFGSPTVLSESRQTSSGSSDSGGFNFGMF